MEFKEFSELVANQQVTSGDFFWICDYRHEDIMQKPIRHVKPQEVAFFKNSDNPPGKRIFYTDMHFRPLGKNDFVKKQIIAPYDNTAWGQAVRVFVTERECRAFYVAQCEAINSQIKEAKEKWEKLFVSMETSVAKEIKENI